MKLWDRIQRGMDAGFDSAISAVHTLTEKAGESIELTRLRREKTRLETQVTRRLAELGNVVYEKISAGSMDDLADKLEIKDIISKITKSEARAAEIDQKLNKELKNKP